MANPTSQSMSPNPENVVSLHPYFKAHEGRFEEFRALLPHFVAKTSTEQGCLYYDFTTRDGSEIFCREAYVGAEGVLAHLENVGALLGQALEMSDLIRLEVHGSASELEKLKGPMGALNPAWFVFECGLAK
jgi:quinol monooxygenase YgiN